MLDANRNLFCVRMVRLMRNLFRVDFPRSDASQPPHPRLALRTDRLEAKPCDRLTEIRWERVQTIRAALANGRYDVQSRLNDLLDDPPTELATLGWS